MRRFLHLCLSIMLVSLFTTASMAQDFLYLDYCGNQIGSGKSKTGTKTNVEAAIYLTADMLKPYVGCQVSGLAVGLPANVALPNTITGWVRVDDKRGEKVGQTADVATEAGWNTLSLESAYAITGEEKGLFVGFRYYQETTVYSCLSFVTPASDNGAWVGAEKKLSTGEYQMMWSDVHKTMNGSLSIRAIITGNIPQADLTLKNVYPSVDMVQVGEDAKITGTILNHANKKAVNPVITYSINGKKVGTYTHNCSLAYMESSNFVLTIPGSALTTGKANIQLDLSWGDGTADEWLADNVAQTSIDVLDELVLRKMVCEEATGTWCGWCVRGYVGLKQMKENYPDRFIGIGVHNGDEFVYSIYDNWMAKQISGYPSALINRDGKVYDPDYSVLKGYLQSMSPAAKCEVTVQAALEGNTISMVSKVRPLFDVDHELRVAFVVLEDGVVTKQKNYYSGGGYGQMDGFENLSGTAEIVMHDAARYISNTTGDENSVSDAPRRNQLYYHGATVDLTTIGTNKVQNTANLSVVAMVIDTVTGEILNADITEELNGTGVTDVIPNSTNKAEGIFDLNGRKVSQMQKGRIYIVNGKKVIK